MGRVALMTDESAISGLRSEIAKCNVKKTELEELKTSLCSFDPTVEYVLKSHSHIKWTYYLAGTKYSNETDDEKKAINYTQLNLKTHIDNAISAINIELSNLTSQIVSLNHSIDIIEASKK
ncbi:MAG: hypothetical protein ACLUO7_00450 [Streptococcus sp.]